MGLICPWFKKIDIGFVCTRVQNVDSFGLHESQKTDMFFFFCMRIKKGDKGLVWIRLKKGWNGFGLHKSKKDKHRIGLDECQKGRYVWFGWNSERLK